MAFTYLLNTDIGKVRLLVPDNDATSYLLEDDEIAYFLTSESTLLGAAVACCQQLARRFAQRPDFTADGLTMRNAERARAFAERAVELERSAGSISTATLNRVDGFSVAASDGEY